MTFHPLPSQEELKKKFDYDPATGVLWNRRMEQPAGFVTNGGNSTKPVRVVKHGKHFYVVSRLIWMWVYGEDPGELLVDHKNRDSLDNSLENLRLLNRGQNRRNSKLNRNNRASGYRNVYKNGKKWIARVTIDGKLRSLGTFDTPEKARDAVTKHDNSCLQRYSREPS